MKKKEEKLKAFITLTSCSMKFVGNLYFLLGYIAIFYIIIKNKEKKNQPSLTFIIKEKRKMKKDKDIRMCVLCVV